MRLRRKIRRVIGYLATTQGNDQVSVTEHGKARGSQKYEFTKQEFGSLKKKAIRNNMNGDVIEQFAQAFSYMHQVSKWMRKGTFNSICDWGWDASVRNYAIIADGIERGDQDVELHCRFTGYGKKYTKNQDHEYLNFLYRT
jgi:hypothetical protein